MLDIGGYSTVESIRREIGASMVRSRIMETMLLYMVDTMASRFTNMKNMMRDTLTKKKGKWYNAVIEYRVELTSWPFGPGLASGQGDGQQVLQTL